MQYFELSKKYIKFINMKEFRFLRIPKKRFKFEKVTRFYWTPVSLMASEVWSPLMAQVIRNWLSEYCFGEQYTFSKCKYFPEIDRTCDIIQTGLDTVRNERIFTAIVQIHKSVGEYMEVHLEYPLDLIETI